MKEFLRKIVFTLLSREEIFGGEVGRNIQKGKWLNADSLENARLLPSRFDALQHISQGGIIAEVGVAYGLFSRKLLDTLKPAEFHAIDTYNLQPADEPWGQNRLRDTGLNHRQYIERSFAREIAENRFFVHQGLSWDALESFPDNYFDYVYLDAGHDYESVSKDIGVLARKVKDGGIIQFNDYILLDWKSGACFGVVRAVDEFLLSGTHEFLFLCLEPEGYYDAVVRVRK